jgi:hypothetical protein
MRGLLSKTDAIIQGQVITLSEAAVEIRPSSDTIATAV